MSVRFARLRIAGFKSFAEAASVEILPGLTGIVGPNGCGKSNVVEALRWAMGESSARSLRGGEMDDLIFAGTAARPARNLAEVTLTLEEAVGIAPPPFHDQQELQISRRIERGSGSSYRVNGREARARDVQTLFADLASGARSSAMVSQGRVAAIVNARPDERRSILEEAAGITGLHARRHEAELKLRATEANLARAEDLRLQLEARLDELGTQSRQASRYREIASGLREAEAALLGLLHARARLAVRQAREQGAATAAARAEAERRARAAGLGEQQAEAALAAPREAEAEARTSLERQRIAAETLAREEARAAADAQDARTRVQQSAEDAEQAAHRLEDARAALARIQSELEVAEARREAHPQDLRDAEQALHEAQTVLADATAELSQATAHETALQSRADRLERDREATVLRISRLQALESATRDEHRDAAASLPADDALVRLQSEADAAAAEVEAARLASEQAGEARAAGARAADAARAAATEAARVREAAERAATEATQRAARLEQERQSLAARLDTAERNRVPDADRVAAEATLANARDVLATARLELERAETGRIAAERSHAEARQAFGEAEGRRQQVEQALTAAQAASARAQAQHDQIAREAAQAEAARAAPALLQQAAEREAAAGQALASSQQALTDADTLRADAEQEFGVASLALADAQAEQARIEAEAEGLASALGALDMRDAGGEWHTLAETLNVPDGLEASLAAILAEGLSASLDEAAPAHFRRLAPITTRLPGASRALSELIAAPEPLARLLQHAGLIEDQADGAALQPDLSPGQCLVTRAGDLWRWDGYSARAGSGDTAAARGTAMLEHRGRLERARRQIEMLGERAAALRERVVVMAALRQERQSAQGSARKARDTAEQALSEARTQHSALAAREASAAARLDAIIPQREATARLLEEAVQTLSSARTESQSLPDAARLRETVERAREAEQSALRAERSARAARQQAEAAEQAASRAQAAIQSRHGEAESRLEALLPQSQRLDQEHRAAGSQRDAAVTHLDALPPAAQARQALEDAIAALETLERDETAARQRRRDAERAQDQALATRTEMLAQTERQHSRIAALTPRLAALEEECREAAEALDALELEASTLDDPALAALRSDAARRALHGARNHEAECREARAQRAAQATSLASTITQLAETKRDWERRAASASQDHEAALLRLDADRKAHDIMQEAPRLVVQARSDHADALAGAEQSLRAAAATLAEASDRLLRAQTERRQADSGLVEARETELRLQGRAEQADAILAQLLAETPNPPASMPEDVSDAAEASLRRRIARLARERDEMGPVNLRADIESQEAQTRSDTIARERDDLETAIARLRGSIGHLNREGRERLLGVFQEVDRHFQSLFARMFNGGRAHLGMVGDDDPLQAGLEIYAQPPGKKLATLSLLSGGEQALTALSLIFAVFRCNPAPVCVLDEVDAPLDDANVGRFVALLSDMVAEAGTRFLVVTHHQLTMAHMDRLYGVTMQERGVSRLLSVDLAAATGMVMPARERV